MLGGAAVREGGRLVVRTSPGPMSLGALLSALAAAMGAYLCAAPLGLVAVANPPTSASARLLFLAAGVPNLLFFGFCLAFCVGRIARLRRPIFEVGPEGILDRASALGAGFMPWEEVEGARVKRFLGTRLLAVELRDARALRALLTRQGPVKRLLMGVNRRLVGTPVLVPLGLLAVREDTLLREIGRHLSRPRGARNGGGRGSR